MNRMNEAADLKESPPLGSVGPKRRKGRQRPFRNGVFGALIWAAACVWLLFGGGSSGGQHAGLPAWLRSGTELLRQPSRIAFSDPEQLARRDDPVFWIDSQGLPVHVGRVAELDGASGAGWVELYDCSREGRPIPDFSTGSPDLPTFRWTSHRNTGSLAESTRLLLPEDLREDIREKVRVWAELHGREVASELVPIFRDAFAESVPIVEAELEASLERHRDEWEALVGRFRDEVVSEKLLPIAQSELMPMVRKHGEPIATDIGRELWDRASLWRFSWRAVYDKSPLPKKDLVAREWQRFVENDAIPVLEAHTEEIADAVMEIIGEAANNPKLRDAIRDAAFEIARDPEAQRLVRLTVRETLLTNPRLREVWTQALKSERAQVAMRASSERIEPLVREIGDMILGTPDAGISPGFARVLRRQVLRRDRSWVQIQVETEADQAALGKDTPEGSAARMRDGGTDSPFPIVHLATPDRSDS